MRDSWLIYMFSFLFSCGFYILYKDKFSYDNTGHQLLFGDRALRHQVGQERDQLRKDPGSPATEQQGPQHGATVALLKEPKAQHRLPLFEALGNP